MEIFPENFERLHFTETNLSAPKVEGRTVTIPVKKLLPLAGHPLVEMSTAMVSGVLVFRGVFSSKRVLTEYIGDPRNPDGFKEDYEIEDMDTSTPSDTQTLNTYSFEGLLEVPLAWVDWDIKAQSFELQIEG